jgi:hypothetical protein
MTTAAGTAVLELASSGLMDNPALHVAIVVPLVLIGLVVYLVRRRRTAGHETDGDHDRHGGGTGSPTNRQPRE